MKKLILFASLSLSWTALILGSCDVLPEEVAVSDIPDYYFTDQYLDNRVESINETINGCSGNYDAFFWITDMHWEPDLNTRKSPILIKYLASKTGIKKVLNGGDTGNSQVICKNAIYQLRDAIECNSVYSVTGNHEMYDATRYELPFERVADELRGHNADIVYGDKNKSSFYIDEDEEKTRIIGLASFGLYLDDKYESCYTEEQLSWFRNTALTVDPGWTIIVFTHSLYAVNITSDKLYKSPAGASQFIDAIDNYKGNGTIACVLMGHSHRDRIHVGSSNVPYIISACDRYVPYNGDINVERVPGTTSEQHFEVVVIDKDSRKINMISIGANARDGYEDDPGEEVGVRIVNY